MRKNKATKVVRLFGGPANGTVICIDENKHFYSVHDRPSEITAANPMDRDQVFVSYYEPTAADKSKFYFTGAVKLTTEGNGFVY